MDLTVDATDTLNQPLQDSHISNNDAEKYIKSYLKKNLPSSDSKNLDTDLKWHFVLDKHSVENHKDKRSRKKKKFLTRREREKLNLLKLPRDADWKYEKLEKMRRMWRDYMRENLDGFERIPSVEDPEWASFSVVLAKSELIGSEITVTKSKNKSLIDMCGTVVLETKETFNIVTPTSQLKVIPKNGCLFKFELDGTKFYCFGKHLIRRPADRSSKKLKNLTSATL